MNLLIDNYFVLKPIIVLSCQIDTWKKRWAFKKRTALYLYISNWDASFKYEMYSNARCYCTRVFISTVKILRISFNSMCDSCQSHSWNVFMSPGKTSMFCSGFSKTGYDSSIIYLIYETFKLSTSSSSSSLDRKIFISLFCAQNQ